MKSCPEAAWKILHDLFETCVGHVLMMEGHAVQPGCQITSMACLMQPLKSSENRTMVELLRIWHDVMA